MSISLDLSRPASVAGPAVEASAPKPSLVGMSLAEIKQALEAVGVEPKKINMRAGQLWHWIYHAGVTDFDAITNMDKGLRATLAQHYQLGRMEVVTRQVSKDGTRKWLLRSAPGIEIEAVFIPDVAGSGALCLSSQVGCTLNCSFCHTGTQKLVRNLTAAEIVAQIMVARDDLDEWPSAKKERKLTNLVFMGMGEPLYNLDNVATAMDIICDPEGLSIGRRRITVSTSGVVPEMARLGTETSAMLAVSLHATNDALRDVLVPINKKYPLKDLMAAIKSYPGLNNARRVTFEYVMLKGVNDSDADARALVQLIRGIPAKINLIPFNPWPGTDYECSSPDRIRAFGDIINRAGYASPVRRPRGRDILAACGQLKSESQKMRASERLKMAESAE